jgi:hypothetical protein
MARYTSSSVLELIAVVVEAAVVTFVLAVVVEATDMMRGSCMPGSLLIRFPHATAHVLLTDILFR